MVETIHARKQVNVIVLDQFENFITWLNPDHVEIIENNTMNSHRKVQITYPIDDIDEELEVDTHWYDQGNKLYIPSTLGIDACLYVINTSVNMDFWKSNIIEIEAEEVLVQLNNVEIFKYTDNKELPVNSTNLRVWFGKYYDIGIVEKKKNGETPRIYPCGTMSKMELLRYIEDQTGLAFVTEYNYDFENKKVNRTLNLYNPARIGMEYSMPLDLNFNMESLEYEIDESDTYNSIAPHLSLSINLSDDDNTSQNSMTTTDLQKVVEQWENLEVGVGERIPMIVKKEQTNTTINTNITTSTDDTSQDNTEAEVTTNQNVSYTAYWNAPFLKEKGRLHIVDTVPTKATYTQIYQYNPADRVTNAELKTGIITSNETDPYAIYNACASTLLNKRYPQVEINVSMKDLASIMHDRFNIGYNLQFGLYDKLYVKIPGQHIFIPCYITETDKNPHLPGENKIKLETAYDTRNNQLATDIVADDQIVQNTETSNIQGILYDENGTPLANQVINIWVQSGSPLTIGMEYDEDLQATETFDPSTETYTFSKSEIENMAAIMQYHAIKENKTPTSVNMRSSTGKIYSVNEDWCRAIYYSYCQQAMQNDQEKPGQSTLPTSVVVKTQDTIPDTLEKTETDLLSAWFYTKITEYQQNNISTQDPILPHDIQQGPSCTADALSMALTSLWEFKPEGTIAKEMGNYQLDNNTWKLTKNTAGALEQYLDKIGIKYFYVEQTQENLYKYTTTNKNTAVILVVNPNSLGFYNSSDNTNHMVHVGFGREGNFYVHDTNMACYNPYMSSSSRQYTFTSFATLLDANVQYLTPSGGLTSQSTMGYPKAMVVIQLSDKNIKHFVERSLAATIFDPYTIKYTFPAQNIYKAYNKMCLNQAQQPQKNLVKSKYAVQDEKKDTYYVEGLWLRSMVMNLLFDGHDGDYDGMLTIGPDSGNANWYHDQFEKYPYPSYGYLGYANSQSFEAAFPIDLCLFNLTLLLGNWSTGDDIRSNLFLNGAWNESLLEETLDYLGFNWKWVNATKNNANKYLKGVECQPITVILLPRVIIDLEEDDVGEVYDSVILTNIFPEDENTVYVGLGTRFRGRSPSQQASHPITVEGNTRNIGAWYNVYDLLNHIYDENPTTFPQSAAGKMLVISRGEIE